MAYKNLINQTGADITVRVITRKGDDPSNNGQKFDVDIPKGGQTRVEYGQDGPYLNGLRIKTTTDGHTTYKRQMVETRGSSWDDTLNTNDTVTIKTTTDVNIQGSNG